MKGFLHEHCVSMEQERVEYKETHLNTLGDALQSKIRRNKSINGEKRTKLLQMPRPKLTRRVRHATCCGGMLLSLPKSWAVRATWTSPVFTPCRVYQAVFSSPLVRSFSGMVTEPSGSSVWESRALWEDEERRGRRMERGWTMREVPEPIRSQSNTRTSSCWTLGSRASNSKMSFQVGLSCLVCWC